MARVIETLRRRRPSEAAPLDAALDDWERVAAVVPKGHPRPEEPPAAVAAFGLDARRAIVDEACASLRRPVGRWLAAKAFASWLALQGEGLRTTSLGLRVAHSVLRAEAARGVAEAAARRWTPSG